MGFLVESIVAQCMVYWHRWCLPGQNCLRGSASEMQGAKPNIFDVFIGASISRSWHWGLLGTIRAALTASSKTLSFTFLCFSL